MMKKTTMAIISMALLTVCTSCRINTNLGNLGPHTESVKKVGNFEKINMTGSFDVRYTQDKSVSVKVTGPSALVKNLIAEVNGNTLELKLRDHSNFFNFSRSDDDLVVYVTSPDLTGITLIGSGDFSCNGKVDTDKLDIEVKGSGELDMNQIVCDNIRVTLTGSGDIELDDVTAVSSSIELLGSGDISIRQRHVNATQIALRGSGDIDLYADRCGSIQSNVFGSGEISLKGNAQSERHDVRGSGSVSTNDLQIK